MARSIASLLLPRARSRSFDSSPVARRSRSVRPAAIQSAGPRQRPTQNLTQQVLRQRPTATMPPTKPAAAHIPPRPSAVPPRTMRQVSASKTPAKGRKR